MQNSKTQTNKEIEVQILNGSVTLFGTLTVPVFDGSYPCVVLLTAPGMRTRDPGAFGFKFLQKMANHLAQNGIAVLRCDKRGGDKSTRDYNEFTLEDFADDALATVRFLELREEIDSTRIGLCGQSEGGWLAALAASRSSKVDFLLLLATVGVRIEEADRIQTEAMGRARGATAEEIEELHLLGTRIYKAARSGEVDDVLKLDIRKLVIKQLESLPEERRPPVDSFFQGQIDLDLAVSRFHLDGRHPNRSKFTCNHRASPD